MGPRGVSALTMLLSVQLTLWCCKLLEPPTVWSVDATSKPPTLRVPSIVVSICTASVGATVLQFCACVTLRGVLNEETTLLSFERVTLP